MLFMSFDLHIAGIFACLMDSFIFAFIFCCWEFSTG